jgi:hypothetical protein
MEFNSGKIFSGFDSDAILRIAGGSPDNTLSFILHRYPIFKR